MKPLLLAIFLIVTSTGAYAGSVETWLSSEDGQYALTSVEGPVLKKARGDADIVVEASKQYQSMLGMGASLEHSTCYNLSLLSAAKREEVIERLVDPVKGIGMNLMRVCIGASDFIGEPYYSYDDLEAGTSDPDLTKFSIDKDLAYVLPAVKIAQAKNPDLLFFASPWSPPGWMKDTGTMCNGKLKPDCYEAYARYLVKFVQAYAAQGAPIYAITPQNEPEMGHEGYPTCLWSGEEERDFIRDFLGPQCRAAGLNTLIWCWDHNWNHVAFPRTILGDAKAAQYVEGTGFHLYEGKVSAQTELRNAFPEKSVYFTEGSVFRPLGAIEIIKILRNWARSYNAWVIMLDQHRKPNRGPHSARATCIELKDDGSVEYRFDYFMYGQFMKFIPRNSVRVESSEGDRTFANVAFRDPEGRMVLVAVNAGQDKRNFSVQCGASEFKTSLGPKSMATYRWKAE